MDASQPLKGNSLEWIKQKIARINSQNQPPPTIEEKHGIPATLNVVKLPTYPELVRVVPNLVLRSALFCAGKKAKKGTRDSLERQEIHAQDGIRIIYTGSRLDQDDLDVWESVLHAVRHQAIGNQCRVTAYQLLIDQEKTDTGINRDTLNERLSRLKATAIDVTAGRYGYEGSLIDEVFRDNETRQYIIRLNPKLSALFAADQFTKVDWRVRRALGTKALAKWLHGFYASHAKPFPIKVETLLKLSGSKNLDPSSGRQTLRNALNALAKASNDNCLKFNYEITDNLVHVQKSASLTQRRHLEKKVAPLKQKP